jgi:hypothetical protein
MGRQVIQVGFDPDPSIDFAYSASDIDGTHVRLTFDSMCKWRFAFHMAQHYRQPDNVMAALGAWDERAAELAECLVDENGIDPADLKTWLARARDALDQRFYAWRDEEDGIARFESYRTAKSLPAFLAYG